MSVQGIANLNTQFVCFVQNVLRNLITAYLQLVSKRIPEK
jgi:hypothetical protein